MPKKSGASQRGNKSAIVSADRIALLQERVLSRKGIIGCAKGYTVGLCENGKLFYTGENRWGQEECVEWSDVVSISAAPEYVLGLLSDGTVRAAGYDTHGQLRISTWSCARSVYAGINHSAAIIRNGHVVCAGDNSHGQCNTSEWEDVCDVVCGKYFTLGLKADGEVLCATNSRVMRAAVSRWSGIVGIFVDTLGEFAYGIRDDGTVVSNSLLPSEVRKWKNLVYLSVADGVYCGITLGGIVNVWGDASLSKVLGDRAEEFVTVALAEDHSAAVNSTGIIIASGDDHFGQCDMRRQKPLFEDFTNLCVNMQAARRRRLQRELEYKKRECEAERFSRRMACSERISVGISAMGRVYTTGSFKDVKSWSDVTTISCGNAHILALHSDGTVSASGNDVDGCTRVSDWHGIVEILAGKYHSLALTSDGKVLFAGQNNSGQGNVENWNGVKHIFGTNGYTLGLTADGRVLATGDGLPVDINLLSGEEWKDIIHLAPSDRHIAALKCDGTVITAGDADYTDDFAGCTSDWQGVKSISAGDGFTVGLCYGGRVLAAGDNRFGQCNTQNWSSVVWVSAGRSAVSGLCADGKVYSSGAQRISPEQASRLFDSPKLIRVERGVSYLSTDTSMLSDIVAVINAPEHTLAIDKGGQMFALGLDSDGQCSVSGFSMFGHISQYDKGVGYYKSRSLENENEQAEVSEITDEEADNGAKTNGVSAHENLYLDSKRYEYSISGGDDHVTIVNDEGVVSSYCFSNGLTITEPPVGDGKKVIKIVSGKAHSAVLYETGDVRLRESFDSPLNPALLLPPWYNAAGLVRAVDICAGDRHTAVLLEDGTVRALGSNKFGQCDVSTLVGIKSVFAGATHTVGLTESGKVISAGFKNRVSTAKTRSVGRAPIWSPCDTEDWTDVKTVRCNADVTLGIKNDGGVLAAGSNNFGQCRTGYWHNVLDVKTSGRHTVALLNCGRVDAVGCGERGECNTSEWKNIVMIAVRSGTTFGLRADGKLLAAGYTDCNLEIGCAIRGVYCFGANLLLLGADGYLYAQRLGSKMELSRITTMRVFTPKFENGIINRRSGAQGQKSVLDAAVTLREGLAVGLTHALRIRSNGRVRAYGSNVVGQGDASAWENVKSVTAGFYFSAGLDQNGRVYSSGKDSFVMPGEDTSRPLCEILNTYLNGNNFKYVSLCAGGSFAAAVRSDGRVYAAGDNSFGQCDLQDITSASAVSCGTHHTAVLLDDGRVVAVGDNGFGQCNTQEWKDVVMLACGENHTVGLTSDGKVLAVGDNGLSQCCVDDIQLAVSIAALPEATLALLPDGTVTIRGGRGVMNKFVSSLREIVAVDACEYRICALSADGKLHFSDSATEQKNTK